MTEPFQIYPVGVIKKMNADVFIQIYDKYKDAMLGLDQFSHIHVLYWFHENDTPERRSILQVYPKNDKKNPLTGVFATHSPVRPNLLALTLCRMLSIKDKWIKIEGIDAIDGTPVIDIKSYNPKNEAQPPVRVAPWALARNT